MVNCSVIGVHEFMSRNAQRPNHYDVLGVPIGASIDHIKDSYRLLTNKSRATDAAYRVLTDSVLRKDYDSKRGKYLLTQAETREDFFVISDEAGWHAVSDNDVGWELLGFLSDRRVRLEPPKPVFGPFSRAEAKEFAAHKMLEAPPAGAGNLEPEVQGSWADLGAPAEMPRKPTVPTHTELHYLAGIEMIVRTGVPLAAILSEVLDYTPEQLFEVSGVMLETQVDLDFFIQYLRWINDLRAWHKTLPSDLGNRVLEALKVAVQGRYKLLSLHLI